MRVLANLIERCEREGLATEHLAEGLSHDLAWFGIESNWVGWDDFMIIMERVEALVGAERFAAMLEAISRDPLNRTVRASLSFAVSPMQLYTLMIRWYGPYLYPVHTATLHRLGRDRIQVELSVPTRYRSSEVFFRTSAAAFRDATHLLGLPDAQVESEIESHRATYRIQLPPSPGFWSKARRIVELFTGSRSAIESLAEQQSELQRSYAALSSSYEQLQERERRLQDEIEERRRAETALRESEAQLLHAQRMEAMGRLAGGIAHDFNNLMTTVLGYTTIHQGDDGPGSDVQTGLREIRRAAERATRLTSQLLAFSRRQVLRPQVLDLNAIVQDMESMMSRVLGDDLELRTVLAEDLSPILADKGQIEQVLLNLAINARDAMDRGGVLTLTTCPVIATGEPPGPGAPAAGTAMVRLAVSDTGVGIPPENRAHIFEPFYTTKPAGQGTGLGLSTVYGIVRQSGGAIHLESKVGEGTTFLVDLPATQRELPAESGEAEAVDLTGRGETVLCVEDERSVLSLLRRMLERVGYEVIVASSAEEALEEVEQRDEPIDLLLSDVVMRGMSGPDLAERVRERWPGLPVILISGFPGDPADVDTERLVFLAKPFTREALLTKVRQTLDAAGRAEPDES